VVRALLTAARSAAAAIAATVLLAGSVLAHETWLLPKSFVAAAGATVELELTSAMTFPQPEHAIAADRLAVALGRTGNTTTALTVAGKDARFLRLAYRPENPGLAVAWISLKPRTIDLADHLIAEYFDEIGASAALRAEWQRRRGKEKWKETYAKHAKVYFVSGKEMRDGSAQQPLGLTLELVPLTAVTSLRAGDRLPVRLLKHGKPLAGLPVGTIIEGESTRSFVSTDADGLATLRLTRPGRVLLFSTDLRRTARDDAWESDFTTLVIQVGAHP